MIQEEIRKLIKQYEGEHKRIVDYLEDSIRHDTQDYNQSKGRLEIIQRLIIDLERLLK